MKCSIEDMHPSFLIPRLESVVGYEKTIPSYVFPRKVRNSIAQDDNPIILQSYLSICTMRTRRLLTSLDELRREARDSMELKCHRLPDGLNDSPLKNGPKKEWQGLLDRVQYIPVVDNDITREFLNARNFPHQRCGDLENWKRYQERRRDRHNIEEYCRSNMVWDWDTSTCLKRLFRIDKPKSYLRSDTPTEQILSDIPSTISLGRDAVNRGTLNVTLPEKVSDPFEKVRIQYMTANGEIVYKTFHAGPSIEDVRPGANLSRRISPEPTQESSEPHSFMCNFDLMLKHVP